MLSKGLVEGATGAMAAALDRVNQVLDAIQAQGAQAFSEGRTNDARLLLDQVVRLRGVRSRLGAEKSELTDVLAQLLPPELEPAIEDVDDEQEHRQERTETAVIDELRLQMAQTIAARHRATVSRHRRALFKDDNNGVRAVCTVSKKYDHGRPYWYAFHNAWGDFLRQSPRGFLALGMIGVRNFACIPVAVIDANLEKLNTTERPEGVYWHLHITEPEPGRFRLSLPRVGEHLDLSPYIVPLG